MGNEAKHPYDVVLAACFNGRVENVAEPRKPELQNYLVLYKGRDWSHYHSYVDALKLLKGLADDKQRDLISLKYFTLVERM